MKLCRVFCVLVLALLWHVSALAQATPTRKSSDAPGPQTFEPLDRWRAAILAGDNGELTALYTQTPPAQAQTPAGKSEDTGEEPAFWSVLAAQGLKSFQPKVLEIQRPRQGAVVLVLRVELARQAGSVIEPLVASVAQLWVQQGSDWRIAVTQRSDLVANPPRRLPEPAKPNTDLYPPPEAASAEIAGALSTAAKDHKRVILVFGGNWCYDCHVLDAAFHSQNIAPLVDANFHIVHINIGEVDKNLDLAQKYGADLKKGVPCLAVLDSDGTLVFGQKQGEFEDSVRIGPDDVVAFLEKWKPVRQN